MMIKPASQMSTNDVANMSKRDIMLTAWAVADAAARKHGGKKSEYFAECLRAVWARVKAARKTLEAQIIGSAEWHRRLDANLAAEAARIA